MARLVLVVEDNENNAEMLSRRLVRHGFDVVVVGDGQSALDAARARRPDVVLMDMSLPVMDGWEATSLLKSDPDLRAIPVIAVTAHTMADDEPRARAAGCDDFHAKPVDFAKLLVQLARLWETSPQILSLLPRAASSVNSPRVRSQRKGSPEPARW